MRNPFCVQNSTVYGDFWPRYARHQSNKKLQVPCNRCSGPSFCDKFCDGYLYKCPASTRHKYSRPNFYDNFCDGYL